MLAEVVGIMSGGWLGRWLCPDAIVSGCCLGLRFCVRIMIEVVGSVSGCCLGLRFCVRILVEVVGIMPV